MIIKFRFFHKIETLKNPAVSWRDKRKSFMQNTGKPSGKCGRPLQ